MDAKIRMLTVPLVGEWHPKVWGWEVWVVNTPLYCAKWLLVAPGAATSVHRHVLKDETFTLMVGDAALWWQPPAGRIITTVVGQQAHVLSGSWHQLANRSQTEWSAVLEVSTHHSEADVERVTESTAGVGGVPCPWM